MKRNMTKEQFLDRIGELWELGNALGIQIHFTLDRPPSTEKSHPLGGQFLTMIEKRIYPFDIPVVVPRDIKNLSKFRQHSLTLIGRGLRQAGCIQASQISDGYGGSTRAWLAYDMADLISASGTRLAEIYSREDKS